MTNISHGAKLATIESHCLYVEDCPKTFSEHFKAALKGFLEVTPDATKILHQEFKVSKGNIERWTEGQIPQYEVAKQVSAFMREYIAR